MKRTDQVSVTIDGLKLRGAEGETVLSVASRNGVEIPHLCFDERLRPFGACGLCVVEVEGTSKLLRSCATAISDGMVVHTQSARLQETRTVILELLMSDHVGDCKGPCSLNCPAGTDVQGYVKRIAEGEWRDAVRIITEHIPLPASIGRVCPHPCENACRRGLVEEPISIAYLKAYAADRDQTSAQPWRPSVAEWTGKQVAVIGGGPAGLSAAYYLAIAGHEVTVFDAMPQMGGMLRYGIPEYRLPKAVLDREIESIARLGIHMRNDTRVGKGIALDTLRNDYDATIVAIGAWRSRALGCTGEDLDGVIGGIEFLRKVARGQAPHIGEKVAVVGGGNTAMDVCRTAVRLGAREVSVIYRRSRDEAPADDIEIAEAIEEGVEFRFLTSPVEVIGEDGHARAIRVQRMELGEPDASGRRSPVAVEGAYQTIEVDTVVAAIGQSLDAAGFEQLELNGRGNIVADETSYQTALFGVFAIGDATNRGAAIAVEAIGEANRAAESVDRYLNGEVPAFCAPFVSEREVTAEMLADRPKAPRAIMPVMPPATRSRGFDEVIEGFTDEQARAEAARCLECGCRDYTECHLIRYANEMPIAPARFDGSKHPAYKEASLGSIERDQGKCILCGLCVRTCEEEVGKGLLGFIGRGFETTIRPAFPDASWTDECAACHRCVDNCPDGALSMLYI